MIEDSRRIFLLSRRYLFLHYRSSILHPSSILYLLKEGERFELSRAEARQFSGLLQYRYANPPKLWQECSDSNRDRRFWRPQCSLYTTLLLEC
jgi:hypothetical protein